MSIIDDTNSIGAALTRLEDEKTRRFMLKRLHYDPTTNAGEFVLGLVQSGKMSYPTVVGDIRISAHELRTAIEIRKYIRWLDHDIASIARYAELATVETGSDENLNAGMRNIKILLCRLRLLQQL